MTKALKELKKIICSELDEIADRGELTVGTLDTVDKLTHSLKSIETILAMQDTDYSNDPYPRHRYYDGRYNIDGRYSKDNNRMIEELRAMMNEVSTEKERTALKDCISKLEH